MEKNDEILSLGKDLAQKVETFLEENRNKEIIAEISTFIERVKENLMEHNVNELTARTMVRTIEELREGISSNLDKNKEVIFEDTYRIIKDYSESNYDDIEDEKKEQRDTTVMLEEESEKSKLSREGVESLFQKAVESIRTSLHRLDFPDDVMEEIHFTNTSLKDSVINKVEEISNRNSESLKTVISEGIQEIYKEALKPYSKEIEEGNNKEDDDNRKSWELTPEQKSEVERKTEEAVREFEQREQEGQALSAEGIFDDGPTKGNNEGEELDASDIF